MPVVILRLSEKPHLENGRPHQCPLCGSEILHRWGGSARIVKDVDQSVARVNRYRCNACGSTFRVYPSGLGRSHISYRIRRLAAIAWTLGMSSRDVATFFEQLGIHLSHATVWRDGHDLLTQWSDPADGQPSRRFNLDSQFLPGVSSRLGVVIAVDIGDGRVSVLGTVDEYNPKKVISRLKMLVGDLAEVITTETKSLYKAMKRASEN
jgi:transposase-like protein